MLIGREKELKILKEAVAGDRSSFIAVYGRRRIGKTFLIREAFDYTFTFQHSGIYNGKRRDQLDAFAASLKEAGANTAAPENWMQAFELLKDLIRNNKAGKKVLFLDELSWMDTPKSGLIMALEHFWNGWASARKDIVLIICSSVTSWMMNKVIHNKGGLYNRLTDRIWLQPFTLRECEQYSEAQGLAMTRYQLLQGYMAFGGVPYYWSLMKKGLSLDQNIDALCFQNGAPLSDEYEHLFSSLFSRPEEYLRIIESLSGKKTGMTRNEILSAAGITGSGTVSGKLEELEACGFIRSYKSYPNRKKDRLYQLMDPFTLFYHHFMKSRPSDENFWTHQIRTPALNAWSGLAFEKVCLWHVPQIRKALGISGVLTDVGAWSCKRNPEKGLSGSQIDLIIVRADHVINLMEMKFASSVYVIDRKTDEGLRRKRGDFLNDTGTKSAIHLTMVTPYGIAKNSYAGDIRSQVTAEDLFQE